MISKKNKEEFANEGQAYWKSLDDRANTPEFQDWIQGEFPQGADDVAGVNRRSFMKIMAASFGLAGFGFTGCRAPTQYIMPYGRQPENMIPGIANYFSSSQPGTVDNIPLVVETHQGRPTKIEGNPSYLPYRGATNTYTQASVLDLYDPDRAQRSTQGGRRLRQSEVKDKFDRLRDEMGESSGRGFAILVEPSTSPTRARLLKQIREEFPDLLYAEFDPLDSKRPDRAASSLLNRPARAIYHLDKAKRVIALDSDFLHSAPASIANAKRFADGRRILHAEEATSMNRLYSIEGNLTLTGSMADHRLRLEASRMGDFLVRLATQLAPRVAELRAIASNNLPAAPYDAYVESLAEDILENRETSLIIPGSQLPEEVQALALYINAALGLIGKTVSFHELADDSEPASLIQLTEAMAAGEVTKLIVIESNPAFTAPGELGWSLERNKVQELIVINTHRDETADEADFHIAASHYLESWGDGRTFDGTLVPVQPMIEPLFQTFNPLELLGHLAGSSSTLPYDLVRETFDSAIEDDNKTARYNTFLAEGFLRDSAFPQIHSTGIQLLGAFPVAELARNVAASASVSLSSSNLEVQFKPSSHNLDGRYANNGWMQECPDPVTKLTWDNTIVISPKLAKDLEAEYGIPFFPNNNVMNLTGQLARNYARFNRGRQEAWMGELTLNGETVVGPLQVLPGLADYAVILPMGFGRRVVGRVGTGTGFDVYPVRPAKDGNNVTGAALKVTSTKKFLANVQEHGSMEARAIIRESSVEDYRENPEFTSNMGMEAHSPPIWGKDQDAPLSQRATEIPRGGSLYKTPEFTAPQQWGMVIDLNTCIGCTACVVACQSENNIPIVGKDQVARGREMHWIRIDRYFSSADATTTDIPEDVQVSFQGVACQHCELAPCETVCPVNATVHDEQGLNTMAYNRCVGTRYCANNCPYKVRRFNFFDWNQREIGRFYEGPLGPKGMPELHQMQKNPNVSVRMRGVMEKCTYCVQRIESAKINQKVKAGASPDILVPDGTIKMACQQACPTESITFGDIADDSTEVSRMKTSDRDYALLGYLNIRPRTTYLSKLRNPNPSMPEPWGYKLPHSRAHYDRVRKPAKPESETAS